MYPFIISPSGSKRSEVRDDDNDTKIQVEESSDEDIIRMDTGGTEVFLLEDDGILTLAKQSGAYGYLGSAQTIKNETFTKIALDAEEFDIQGEFDTATKSGTADATGANKLHDADGGFEASDVGRMVWNTTDNTYTTVSGFVDAGELDLTGNIMVSGEGYTIYQARFTASKAGKYIITAALAYSSPVADKKWITSIRKNGTNTLEIVAHSSNTGAVGMFVCGILNLAESDYLELWTKQYAGGDEATSAGKHAVFMSVFKIV